MDTEELADLGTEACQPVKVKGPALWRPRLDSGVNLQGIAVLGGGGSRQDVSRRLGISPSTPQIIPKILHNPESTLKFW